MFATDEEVRADAEAYDCDGSRTGQTCLVADALHALYDDPLNKRAWELYRQSVSRLTVEGHALGLALEKLTADCDAEMFAELLDRLTYAFDVFNPAPEIKD